MSVMAGAKIQEELNNIPLADDDPQGELLIWKLEFEIQIVFFFFIYLLQLGCYPVAVVILHVNKTWNWLLLDLSQEGYMRSM